MAVIKLVRLCVFVFVLTVVSSRPANVDRDKNSDTDNKDTTKYPEVQDDDDDSTNHMTQYLHHILDQVRQGHVTQNSVDDWKTRLNHALHTGSLTQQHYHDFLQSVKSELLSHSSSNSYCSSCIFWVG